MKKETFEAALSETNQEIERLQILKLSLEQQIAIANGTHRGVTILPFDRNGTYAPYLKLSIPEAVRAHLVSAKGVAQSPAMMAKAVRAGGHPTKAKYLEANIRTLMPRHFKNDPEIVPTRNGRWRYKAQSPTEPQ
jgi:hypothetical protein